MILSPQAAPGCISKPEKQPEFGNGFWPQPHNLLVRAVRYSRTNVKGHQVLMAAPGRLAGARGGRHGPQMETLSERLEYLGRIYHLQVGPLVMLLAIGLARSPVLAWTAGVILALETLNKLYQLLGRAQPETE